MKNRVTVTDFVVAVAGVLVVLCIALVQIQKHRAVARGQVCQNNLKQLGLALHNYHSAYKRLPMGCGGSSERPGAELWENNQDRLAAWVGLTPFFEHQRLWEQIANPYRGRDRIYPPMGPAPWYDSDEYKPWAQRPTTLACPSDKDAGRFPTVASYTLNYGDAIYMVGSPYDARTGLKANAVRAADRGLFFGKKALRFRDCLDGLANTLMFSEACIANQPVAKNVKGLPANPSLCLEASKNVGGEFWADGREAVWADGCLRSVGFQTILPPNSPSCTGDWSDEEGVMPPSSYHDGGVHVAFADGRVQFVLNSIDAGDNSSPSVTTLRDGTTYPPPGSKSPYGLWGALGTRAAKEAIEQDNLHIIDPPRELTELEKEMLQKKPLQTWTAADGKRTIQGRQVDLQSESAVVILTEEGKTQRIPLSMLSSEDAYRAVQQHLAERIEAQNELKERLKAGVKMLDNREFAEFAKAFIQGAELDVDAMANLVELERGLLIHMFESGIRQLELPNQPGVEFAEKDGMIGVRFQNRNRPMISRLVLIYSAGRWQLSPR